MYLPSRALAERGVLVDRASDYHLPSKTHNADAAGNDMNVDQTMFFYIVASIPTCGSSTFTL